MADDPDVLDLTDVVAGRGVNTLYLHVGTMKTGTTYLQSRMSEHRADLADDGVLVPYSQLLALRDRFGRRGTLKQRSVDGEWDRLLASLRATPLERGVISMEFLSTASRERIVEIVEELRPAEVHVIVTARDLARVMVAQWQETVGNRATWTWAEYSDDIVDQMSAGVEAGTGDNWVNPGSRATEPRPKSSGRGRGPAARQFWRQHDLARIIEDWAAVVGMDHLHVVTVPPAGSAPEVLWHRFAQVIGVDPARHDTGHESAPDTVRANAGVDLATAEFVRRLNERIDPGLSTVQYLTHVKAVLGRPAQLGRGTRKPVLRAEQQAAVAAYSRGLTGHLAGLGVHVVGDLDDLVPSPAAPTKPPSDGDLDREVADAAVDAVLVMVRQLVALDGTDGPRAGRGSRQGAGKGARRGGGRRSRRDTVGGGASVDAR